MTSEQEDRRRRRRGGILMALVLAAVAAWLVYLWLDGVGSSSGQTTLLDSATTTTTSAPATTTTTAPPTTTTTLEAVAGPFDEIRSEYGGVAGISALLDFVEGSSPTALGFARLEDGRGLVIGRFGSQADVDAAIAACAATFGSACVEAHEIDSGAAAAPWLEGALNGLDELGGVPGLWVAAGDGDYALRGQVASEETKASIGAAVAAAIAPDLSLVNELEVVDSAVITGGTQSALEDLDLQGITFESGSAVITAEGQAILDEAVAVLQSAVGVAVEVGGHTDSLGSASGNQSLSQARADAVVAYLVDEGVDTGILTAVGFGETTPIADNGTPAGREQNRRIEFTVSAA